jgi:transcriptional regulator with XRE-family HTH domain
VRDIATVYRRLLALGLSQRRLAARTGQVQSEVCEILGGRKVQAYDVLERIAQGLSIPRAFLGLAFGAPYELGPSVVDYPPMPPAPAPGPLPPASPPAPQITSITVEVCARCSATPSVSHWTGAEIRLLRQALRISTREFAAHLGVSDRMVSRWEAGGACIRPLPASQALMDTSLARADPAARRRFAESLLLLEAIHPRRPADRRAHRRTGRVREHPIPALDQEASPDHATHRTD